MKLIEKDLNIALTLPKKGEIITRQNLIEKDSDLETLLFIFYFKEYTINAHVSKIDFNDDEKAIIDYGYHLLLNTKEENVSMLFEDIKKGKFLNKHIACFHSKSIDFVQVYVKFLDKLICFSANLPKNNNINKKNYHKNKIYKMIDSIVSSITTA